MLGYLDPGSASALLGGVIVVILIPIALIIYFVTRPKKVMAPVNPPGWHPDPTTPGQMRWWDGTRWTEHVSAPQSAAQSPPSGKPVPPG